MADFTPISDFNETSHWRSRARHKINYIPHRPKKYLYIVVLLGLTRDVSDGNNSRVVKYNNIIIIIMYYNNS